MNRFVGKVAVVTGAAGGIGRATASALAGEGAQVVLADLDGDGAAGVAEEIEAGGGMATPVRVDLAVEADVAAMVAAAVQRFGRLDVLHNNAALTDPTVLARDTVVTEMDLEVWDRTFAVNLRGHMLVCKHAIPEMTRNGGGAIVNMSSGASLAGDVTRTAYGASKAGVNALTQYVATAYGRQGIRANAIVPGLILTPAVESQVPEAMLAAYAQRALTPYLGRPDDVAGLVLFLASEDARYITGQLISVDGGMSSHAAGTAVSRDARGRGASR